MVLSVLRDPLDRLYDEPRLGAPRRISDEQIEQVIVRTLEETRAGRRTKAARGMAKASGVGRTTVRQIWRALGLPPHRSKTFRLSNDPLLIEKVRDIVGLYMNPPEHAAPFCGERLKSRSCSQRLTACTSLRGAGEDPA